MKPTIKMVGFRELDAALAEFSKATARNVAMRALEKAAVPIAEKARELAPVAKARNGGKLRKSIIVSRVLARGAGDVEFAMAIKEGRGKTNAIAARLAARKLVGQDKFAQVFIGPAYSFSSWRARLQEFGVAPHEIKPRKRNKNKRLSFSDGGFRVMPAIVHHPGHAPHPFMRPAFEAKKEEAIGLIAEAMRTEIAAAADRARRRALKKKG